MTRNSPRRTVTILPLLFFLSSISLPADEQRSLDAIADWIGLELSDALERFGPPASVYPLRGLEAWQDDVVFSWPEFELYWFENRVWQVRFQTLGEIPRRASPSIVKAVLGEPLFDYGTTWVYQRGGKAWPLRLRVDFDALPPANSPNPATASAGLSGSSGTVSGGAVSVDTNPLPAAGALKAFYLYRADF